MATTGIIERRDGNLLATNNGTETQTRAEKADVGIRGWIRKFRNWNEARCIKNILFKITADVSYDNRMKTKQVVDSILPKQRLDFVENLRFITAGRSYGGLILKTVRETIEGLPSEQQVAFVENLRFITAGCRSRSVLQILNEVNTIPLAQRVAFIENWRLSTQDMSSAERTEMIQRVCSARRQLTEVGGSNTQNKTDADLIARTVMRYPNQEAKKELYRLHEVLRFKFQNQSDAGLQWLLGGASKDARGGFKDVASLRKFLNEDPDQLSPSSLITGLSTLVTAIAYRALGSANTEPPTLPETDEQRAIAALIVDVNKHVVPDYSKRYLDIRLCVEERYDYGSSPKENWNSDQFLLTNFRPELSYASDVDDDSPLNRIQGGVYGKTRDDGKKTWFGAAEAGGIPFRASISASALISLATLKALLPVADSNTLTLLAGTLIVPTYHRADYHSIAETGAAFQHYLDECDGNNDRVLTPHQALAKGLTLMTECVDLQYKESVQVLNQKILASTRDVGYETYNA